MRFGTLLAFLVAVPSFADVKLVPDSQLPLLSAFPALADVKIPSIVQANPGQTIQMTAKSAGSYIRFYGSAGLAVQVEGNRAVVVAYRPGKYLLTAISVDGQTPSASFCWIYCGVDPPVDPIKPPPPDKPLDTKGRLHVVVIEETTMPGSNRTMFLADSDLAAVEKAKVIGKIHWIDQNAFGPGKKAPPASLIPYLRRAEGKPLPHLILVADKATVPVYDDRLPATPAEFAKLIADKAPEVKP